MKQSTICFQLWILPAILLLGLSVVAQQRQVTAPNRELAVEVTNVDGRPWEIRAFDGGGGEGSSFKRIKEWKPTSRESPVDSIVFKVRRDSDVVIVDLSVRLENEKVVKVGTYRMREHETATTEELTKFGVEPLMLKVIKAKPRFKDPLPPIQPQLENKTKSIEVVSFYQAASSSESFELSLRNVSNKNIIALDLFMPSPDGNGGDGLISRGDKTHPVMLPGAISVENIGVSRGGRMTPNGYVPDPAVQRTLIIRTVVFDDGTYDGLVEPAAEMAAQRRGLDIQRKRILRLFDDRKSMAGGDSLKALDDLKEQAYALDKNVDASVIVEVKALFPALEEKSKNLLQRNVEEGLREGKLELLRYINDFEEAQKRPGVHTSFGEWIKQTRVKYEKMTGEF